MSFAVSPKDAAGHEEKLNDSIGALFAARLAQRTGMEGGHAANHLTRHNVHGGRLATFVGAGLEPPSYEEIEGHLGEGFGHWVKKSIKKAGRHLAKNKDAMGKLAQKGAIAALKAAEGEEGTLMGGLRAGASEVGNAARDDATKRIRALITA